jgi:signal peptidase II
VQERRVVLTALTDAAPDGAATGTAATDPGAGGGSRRRLAVVGVIALAVAGADQVTKTLAIHYLAPGGRLDCATTIVAPRHVVWTLWWELTCNSGAAFGLGRGVTPVVEVVVVALVAGLLLAGRRAARGAPASVLVGIGLLLGGSIGNLVDRVARGNGGAVVDFVDIARIGSRDYWPVFNLADSAIVVGAVLLVVGYGRSRSTGADGG